MPQGYRQVTIECQQLGVKQTAPTRREAGFGGANALPQRTLRLGRRIPFDFAAGDQANPCTTLDQQRRGFQRRLSCAHHGDIPAGIAAKIVQLGGVSQDMTRQCAQ